MLSPWLLMRAVRTGRYRSGLGEKLLGLAAGPQFERHHGDSARIWLHGVSVGEIQMLAGVVKELRREQPTARVFVSTTTDTGFELARKLLDDDVVLFRFPLDFSWAIGRTLARVRPDVLVLGELELWPNMLAICHQRQVPVMVVNGRLSERSLQGYKRWAMITKPMFAKLARVCAQSEEYAQRFRQCGCKTDVVVVSGNIKFDNLCFDRDAESICELRHQFHCTRDSRYVVVGSTQDPEETMALQAFLKLRAEHERLKLVLVPRHPERFDDVAKMLDESGVRWLRRSSVTDGRADCPPWDVLLVDTVGELRWWWGMAEIAIVGGSFGSRGGQNMLEPAAYGANVAFGPNTSNFRDVVLLLKQNKCVTEIPALDAIDGWLREQLSEPEAGAHRGRLAQELIRHHQGALQRSVAEILAVVTAGDVAHGNSPDSDGLSACVSNSQNGRAEDTTGTKGTESRRPAA